MLQSACDATKDMRKTSKPQEWIYSSVFALVMYLDILCVLDYCMDERIVCFSQNPREFYLVGNTVQYSCIDEHYLSGDAVAECTENKTWRRGAMVCKSTSLIHSCYQPDVSELACADVDEKTDILMLLSSRKMFHLFYAQNLLIVPGSTCRIPQLKRDVIPTPTKVVYQIGELVTLSCPEGSMLEGDVSQIMCSPSLLWSPSPASVLCKAGMVLICSLYAISQVIPSTGCYLTNIHGYSIKLEVFNTVVEELRPTFAVLFLLVYIPLTARPTCGPY